VSAGTTVELTCQSPTCGTTFTRPAWRARQGVKFCSKECAGQGSAVVVTTACAECGAPFTANETAKRIYCSQTCFRAARRKTTEAKRIERTRAQEATKHDRALERRATRERRALERLTTRKHTNIKFSNRTKPRVEPPTTEVDLTRQPQLAVAQPELAAYIEDVRREFGLSSEQLGLRVEQFSSELEGEASGARSIRRILDADSDWIELERADELTLGAGSSLAHSGLTALTPSITAARHAVNTRAELDEEVVSDLQLERRARSLLHFSYGFWVGIAGLSVDTALSGIEDEPIEQPERSEVAA
jgi:hypothetical protein